MVSVSSAPLSSKPAPSHSRQSAASTPGSGSESITASGAGPNDTLRTVDRPCGHAFRQRRDPAEIADVEPLEREYDRAAAALAEARAEREALEPPHARRCACRRAAPAARSRSPSIRDGRRRSYSCAASRVTIIFVPASRGAEPSTRATVTSTTASPCASSCCRSVARLASAVLHKCRASVRAAG